jgi:hypothetical protein
MVGSTVGSSLKSRVSGGSQPMGRVWSRGATVSRRLRAGELGDQYRSNGTEARSGGKP